MKLPRVAMCVALLWSGLSVASGVSFSQDSETTAEPSEASTTESEAKPDVATEEEEKDEEVVVVDPLLTQVEEAIEVTSRRYLKADVHTPWQIMHGILALRQGFLIRRGTEKVPAFDWATGGATYQGTPLFEKTQFGGRAHLYTEPYAFEGHPNQFQAIMTMLRLPVTQEFRTADGSITMADMVRNAQMDVNDQEETTWTLWFLAAYLKPDAQWRNRYGQHWSIERLVEIQNYEDPADQACGGCHALFALSYARNAYLHSGKRLTGVWAQADQKIRRYRSAAQHYQNQDGSFSTQYFAGPGFTMDFADRLEVSGHMLEWIIMSSTKKELQEPWVRNALNVISSDLLEQKNVVAKCGPLYHALHGLVLYRDRMQPKKPVLEVAEETETQEEQAVEEADGKTKTTSDEAPADEASDESESSDDSDAKDAPSETPDKSTTDKDAIEAETTNTKPEASDAPRTLVVKDPKKLVVKPVKIVKPTEKKPQPASDHELEPPVDLFD
ncbi:MAG: hypothetical protein CMJ48_09840 [Planctomycetaceae bacterium]|nr:hypothetical protein [Planctomycetaceae bacterium]